ncbi:MAG: hypothetical protein LH479_05895 [Polaromonas sp.]|nr:hypothetical protein [Polaromonas sp.]
MTKSSVKSVLGVSLAVSALLALGACGPKPDSGSTKAPMTSPSTSPSAMPGAATTPMPPASASSR